MDNSISYLSLNRQIGLSIELDVLSNNISNINTSGFRREGVNFTEFVLSAENENSISMADIGARHTLDLPGAVVESGGALDVAIEGEGFFLIDGVGERLLTRAGAFQVSDTGVLSTPGGAPVLDVGGGQIPIGIDTKEIQIAEDGTVSANGIAISQIAIVTAPPTAMTRVGDTSFSVIDGAFEALENPRVRQGALEKSNVNPVHEIARMIEITRAYEMAQSVIQDEDERIRDVIQTLSENV